MNKKLKEQLELVIIQCSALKAKLDEATARNRQYEAEIDQLRKTLAQQQSPEAMIDAEKTAPAESERPDAAQSAAAVAQTDPPAADMQAAEEPMATAFTDASQPEEAVIPDSAEAIPDAAPAKTPDVTETPSTTAEPVTVDAAAAVETPAEAPNAAETSPALAEAAPAPAEASEAQSFQSILETGAEMVSQAVATSREYIQRLEAAHPDGCSSLMDIIRSRTDLFKVEISGIIGGFGTNAEKREKMNAALIKLVQYFENVK